MSYDKKIREQAMKYRQTHTKKETAETFGVSESAIRDWTRQLKDTGGLEKKPLERKWRKIDPEKLRADVLENPDDFNSERAERFGCTDEGIRQSLKKHKITRKKNDRIRRT